VRYWWVNQNKTFRHEFGGGYLWSPKRKSNGARNPFYEFMREISPGDLVFCFADTRIPAYGMARSHAYEAPKPAEFGSVGRNWDDIGWRVDVSFEALLTSVRPADWMERLAPLLPTLYAPLLPDGRGVQSLYLTELTQVFALALADLISPLLAAIARREAVAEEQVAVHRPELALWEEHLHEEIHANTAIPETEREALILARRGQGAFREGVQRIERICRVTRVDRPEHLRASHCKPWRDSNNAERLDPENGLLLTPSIDHLFDRGFISFASDGRLLVSPVAHEGSLSKMGVPSHRGLDTGPFTQGQSRFLEYHRDEVFLRSSVKR